MVEPREAFDGQSTTDDVLEGVDLSGMCIAVTGASAGLGAETVRGLSAHGARVIAAVRDPAKAERALAGLGVADTSSIALEHVELSSLTSVRDFTTRVLAQYPRLDVIIANAGVMACPETRTSDGFELQFATNHLGHFVLVNRLVPLLLASAPSRVVCLTSVAHRSGEVDLADPNFESTPYNPWSAYSRSKTANVLFAVELDRRLRGVGVRACAVHPGGIDTELFRHLDEDQLAFVAAGRASLAKQQARKSIPQGAATSVWAAVVADADEIGGRYLENCGVAPVIDDADALRGVRSFAVDQDRAAELWQCSETLVAEHFPPPD